LLLGVIYGFKHLLASGVIDNIPRIIAVQPAYVSPLYHAFRNEEYDVASFRPSVADALTASKPPRLAEIVRELHVIGGDVTILSEEEILRATKELVGMGFHVEPSASVGYGAFRRDIDRIIDSGEEVVVMLTGSGLKAGKHV